MTVARARKGGDPAAKRFQPNLSNLRRSQPGPETAAAAEEPAVVETDEPKAERPKRSQAKTKLR